MNRKNSGFTLIEIVIALTLLSLGLVMLMGGMNAGVMFGERDRDYTIATFLAEQKMTELERDPLKIASGSEENGRFEGEFDRFEWDYIVAPDESVEALAAYGGVEISALKAVVTIKWEYKNSERKYSLEEIFMPTVENVQQ